jgi:hypothetical protein
MSSSRSKHRKKRESVVTHHSLDKVREDVARYNVYFDGVLSEHAPKAIQKVQKMLIDPSSPFEVKTGSITKYGHRELDDWTGFHNSRY